MADTSIYAAGIKTPSTVYLVDAKTKRLVPDTVTLALVMAQAGQTAVRIVADASLTLLKTGPALPSRRDGVLYVGTDKTIDMMRGGLRRRFPDATTQLSLGA